MACVTHLGEEAPTATMFPSHVIMETARVQLIIFTANIERGSGGGCKF